MRTFLLFAIVLAASPAAADVWLANPPSPPPEPAKPYVRPLLGDRWTMTAQVGVGLVQFGDVANTTGMMINPTLTRTFDRFELSADYLALDWYDETGMRSGGTLHRLGGELRYQVGRIRIQKKMTMDAVATAGLGWQHFVQDHGAAIDRADSSLGVVLRMITDLDDRDKQRLFCGWEIGARLLVARGGDDRGFVVGFGVPIGW